MLSRGGTAGADASDLDDIARTSFGKQDRARDRRATQEDETDVVLAHLRGDATIEEVAFQGRVQAESADAFLALDLDVQAMVKSIRPDLHRQRG